MPKRAELNTVPDMKVADKKPQTDEDWLRECFEYEATHEIAFASPKALLEARIIAATDKALRPRRRAKTKVRRSAVKSQ